VTITTTTPVPQPLPTAAPGRAVPPEAARRTVEEFEAMFLAQMLAGLFQGSGGGEGGLGGGGASGLGGEAFEGMLRDEYARLISRAGGIGLADEIRREMLKLQEVA
jgi:peptidoglycan hydrolase FlgJ